MELFMIFRILIGALGVLAFYAAFFMYEDEEGRWQNRIEQLWISISDRALLVGSKSAAFFNKVADIVTVGFNRMFGVHLMSLRMIGASTAYSLAFFLLLYYVLESSSAQVIINEVAFNTRHIVLVFAVIFALAAILPAVFASRWFVAISFFPLAIIALYFWVDISTQIAANKVPEGPIILAMSMPIGVASDILLLAVVRSLVRYISINAAISRILLATVSQIMVGLVLILGPILFLIFLQVIGSNPGKMLSRGIEFVSVFNIFSAILAFSFSLTLIAVLLHRLTWPSLGRLIYPFARYEFVRNRKFLATFGSVCIMFSFQFQASSLSGFVQMLGK
jgi:hypothetical protein